MSKKNFGYTSVSNIKRRLGTWDSRKPGQSPKEMKALLEKTDNTLKNTKMGPERQGLNDRRYPTNYNSESMKFIRNHNAMAKYAYPNPIPESPNTKKSHKTNVLITKSASKVQDKVSIKSSKPDKFIDSIVRHNTGVQKLSNRELKRLESSSGSKVVQELRQTKPKGVHHTTYRTQGKQDLLEGKPRKTTVSAKAGAGYQHIKAQFQRYGAKQWWKSKTH